MSAGSSGRQRMRRFVEGVARRCQWAWEICLQRWYRFYGVLQTRKSSLLSLPRVTLHSLSQARTKFILEVRRPVPESKECSSRAFIKFRCVIKGPIVSSLKQDYPSGISCSAWVRKTATLHFPRKLLLPAEMHCEAAEARGKLSTRETQGCRCLETGPKRSFYTNVGLIGLDS